jgi:hypothetical protein
LKNFLPKIKNQPINIIMNYKLGYILGLLSTIIYTITTNGINFSHLLSFIAAILGALLIPATIAGLISLFAKGKNYGKVFGITCIVVHIMAYLGNSAA